MSEKQDKKPAYEVILDYLERQGVAFGEDRRFFGGELMEAEKIAGTLTWILAQMTIPPEARRTVSERLYKLTKGNYPLAQYLHDDFNLKCDVFRELDKEYKPTLLDIARRAVLEAGEEWARKPAELTGIITNWWVPGAKALGLTVSVYYNTEEPVQPPEIHVWLLNEKKTASWPRPDSRGFLPPEERGQWRRPRELGEVMEFQGRRYVLIGFIQSEHWSSGIVESAAFVPAEEVQL